MNDMQIWLLVVAGPVVGLAVVAAVTVAVGWWFAHRDDPTAREVRHMSPARRAELLGEVPARRAPMARPAVARAVESDRKHTHAVGGNPR